MPYPSLLNPESLPVRQSTAEPYLHRRHSNTVLSQSLESLGPGVQKVMFVSSKSLFPQSCVSSGSFKLGL